MCPLCLCPNANAASAGHFSREVYNPYSYSSILSGTADSLLHTHQNTFALFPPLHPASILLLSPCVTPPSPSILLDHLSCQTSCPAAIRASVWWVRRVNFMHLQTAINIHWLTQSAHCILEIVMKAQYLPHLWGMLLYCLLCGFEFSFVGFPSDEPIKSREEH